MMFLRSPYPPGRPEDATSEDDFTSELADQNTSTQQQLENMSLTNDSTATLVTQNQSTAHHHSEDSPSANKSTATLVNHPHPPSQREGATPMLNKRSNEPGTTNRDLDAWAKKTVLSLDSGGIRGYSSLVILQALMQEIALIEDSKCEARSSSFSPLVDCLDVRDYVASSPEDSSIITGKFLLPCHYFDYIAGSQSGGLIAIMLGRLRMSVEEAMEEYKSICANILERSNSKLKRSVTGYSGAKMSMRLAEHFENLVPRWPSPEEQKRIFWRGPHEPSKLFQSDVSRCRTIVCPVQSPGDHYGERPKLFRSYEEKFDSIYIWEAAVFACAVPEYVPENLLAEHPHDKLEYIHNPASMLLDEIDKAERRQQATGILLSVGGGAENANDIDVCKVRDKLAKQKSSYLRLDVGEPLQKVLVPGWSTKVSLDHVTQLTKEYTSQFRPKSAHYQIQELARELVERRIARSRNMQWERWATGMTYKCPECSSKWEIVRFDDRNMFLEHLRKTNRYSLLDPVNPPALDASHYQQVKILLDAGRTNK
ncbi:hypothetical protein MMC28_001092 [Mycoblastus sanguinarius]|nr:hypothetical protein [Mycoblastus sanguinarius]